MPTTEDLNWAATRAAHKRKETGMNRDTVFETLDLYLSAAFVMFNAGVRVSASVYAETIKRMRAEMIMRRNRRDGK